MMLMMTCRDVFVLCVCVQTSFFFGYMGIVAYSFFLMLGFIGFYSALIFVRYIYGSIKTE